MSQSVLILRIILTFEITIRTSVLQDIYINSHVLLLSLYLWSTFPTVLANSGLTREMNAAFCIGNDHRELENLVEEVLIHFPNFFFGKTVSLAGGDIKMAYESIVECEGVVPPIKL